MKRKVEFVIDQPTDCTDSDLIEFIEFKIGICNGMSIIPKIKIKLVPHVVKCVMVTLHSQRFIWEVFMEQKMNEKIIEELQWRIELMQKVIEGETLQFNCNGKGWKDWDFGRDCFPLFNCGKEDYRIVKPKQKKRVPIKIADLPLDKVIWIKEKASENIIILNTIDLNNEMIWHDENWYSLNTDRQLSPENLQWSSDGCKTWNEFYEEVEE